MVLLDHTLVHWLGVLDSRGLFQPTAEDMQVAKLHLCQLFSQITPTDKCALVQVGTKGMVGIVTTTQLFHLSLPRTGDHIEVKLHKNLDVAVARAVAEFANT